MERLHPLIRRQVRKSIGDLESAPESVRQLVMSVNESYIANDSDRAMLERSLELSSQELVQANSDMRAVFLTSPDAFIWVGEDGRVLSAQSGTPLDQFLRDVDVVGKRVEDLLPQGAHEGCQDALAYIDRGAPLVGFEYEAERGGEQGYFEAQVLRLVNRQVLYILRDISDRKRAQLAVAEEKERLSVTLRSIEDGVITTDAEGRIRLMNEVAQRLVGLDALEAEGKRADEILRLVDPKSLEPVSAPIEEVLAGRAAPRYNNVQLHPHGSDESGINVAFRTVPVHDQRSRITGAVVAFRDVTEDLRREREHLRASKLESVGVLAGGIAHDFNNILTSVLMNISCAKLTAEDTAGCKKLLAEAERGTARAAGLTQQLLTFSKGGAPVKATASLEEVVRESTQFALRGSGVQFLFNISEELLPVEIDEGQISQVINNLIINASQAMPEGGKLEIRGYNQDVHTGASEVPSGLAAGSYVVLEIEDNGIGIAPEHLAKIFDPYFSTKQSGSGLGLASCYSIIRNHDGLITVSSEIGVGTTFRIFLPSSHKGLAKESGDAEIEVKSGRGRVLVMDDERNILDALGAMLRMLGYQVTLVEDGSKALAEHSRVFGTDQAFDAVIMDLTIPGGMGGKETIAQLREIDSDICAIVSSGYSNDPIMARFEAFGFNGVLTKPYTAEQVCRVLSKVLGSERGCRDAEVASPRSGGAATGSSSAAESGPGGSVVEDAPAAAVVAQGPASSKLPSDLPSPSS